MRSNHNELLFSLLIFGAGVIFGLIFQSLFKMNVENTISLSDLFTLIFTIFLGIYIGSTITGKQSSNRFEKELLISEIKRITDYLDSQSVFRNTESIDYNNAKSSFKQLNITIFNIGNVIRDAGYSKEVDISILRQKFSAFRNAILGLTPQNSVIIPSQQERTLIVNSYSSFRSEVFKAIVKVNTC